MLNAKAILEKHINPKSECFRILWNHSVSVKNKAIKVVKKHPELKANISFIEEAALLHDIGIVKTNAPIIDCHGTLPYIAHGFSGHDILVNEGLSQHALVCERHTGTGLSLQDIQRQKLPLPHRDMLPVSIEEQIICYADKFFSKTKLGTEFTPEKVKKKLLKFGEEKTQQFIVWHEKFK